MVTVPAHSFAAPVLSFVIAARLSMPGVCAVLMSNSPERTIRTPLDRHRLIDSDMVTLRRRAQTVYARQPTAQMPCARDDGVTPNLKSLINVQCGHGIDDNRTFSMPVVFRQMRGQHSAPPSDLLLQVQL